MSFKLPAFGRTGTAHISLTLVGIMWVLPFLYYRHAYPLTTFYQEWGAALLGLCASIFLLNKEYWQQAEIPRIVQLPIMLMFLALLQYLLGMTAYFEQIMLFTLYMLWATLLLMLGHALRIRLGLPLMVTVLASFLLLGAELNALIGILQHYRWHTFLDAVVTSKNGIAVYGNLAQPNHYASYIAMGLISLGLLRPQLRNAPTIFLALPLLFVLVLSGSRSSWLYLLGMAALAFLWQHRDKTLRHLLNYSLLLLAGFLLMHWVVQISWLAETSGSVTAMQRLIGADSNGSIRLQLWHEAWIVFTRFPLLGAGLGEFAWQHFQLVPELQATQISGLYNNAHNMIMQLAAEMGLSGVLILLGAVGMWIWQGLRTKLTIYHWWAYAVMLVLGIHSMLEYPLWYAYFMGVAAVLMGMLDESTYRLELRNMGRISAFAIVALGMVSLIQLLFSYQQMERILALRPQSAVDQVYTQRLQEGLKGIAGNGLLRPYAELFQNNLIEISSDNLDIKSELNNRSAKFIPISHVVYLRAWLLALENKQDEARLQLKQSIWSYPGNFPAQKEVLMKLAQKDPAHFSALLEFGIEKNEEYLNAISAK